jgi:putative transcriptional regulator
MKNRVWVYMATYNLTQVELAHHQGVTRQTIFAIEKEQYDPSLESVFKNVKLSGAKIEDMFIFSTLEKPPPPIGSHWKFKSQILR